MSVTLYEDGDFEKKGSTLRITNNQMRSVLEAAGLSREGGPSGLCGILTPEDVSHAFEGVSALDHLPGATLSSGRRIRTETLTFLEGMEGKSVVYS